MIVPTQQCSKCGEAHPATREFFGSTPSGNLRKQCRACVRAAVSAYTKENPRKLGSRHGYAVVDRKMLYSRQKGLCICCGQIMKSAIDAEVDHLVPVSKGGLDILSNVALVHSQCNREKHNKTIDAHWAWRVTVGLDKAPLTRAAFPDVFHDE